MEEDKLFCDGGGNEFIKMVFFLLVESRAVHQLLRSSTSTAVHLHFTQGAVHGLP